MGGEGGYSGGKWWWENGDNCIQTLIIIKNKMNCKKILLQNFENTIKIIIKFFVHNFRFTLVSKSSFYCSGDLVSDGYCNKLPQFDNLKQ